jgi:hypothetical protein
MHLSVDNLTRLQRSLVTARFLAPSNKALDTPLSQTSLLP